MTTDTKVVQSGAKRRPPAAGSGRKKGSQNKITATIKEAIEQSFNQVGGAAYLVKMATEQPQAYMTLLGKVLPTQVNLKTNEPIAVTFKVVGDTDRPE